MVSGGNVRRAYALLSVVFCFVLLVLISQAASAAVFDISSVNNSAGPRLSFSDLLAKWGSALVDPATYTTLAHVDGFFSFLMNETFLSAFSSNAFGSLSRSTILGTIPNVFFVVCILCIILSLAVTAVDLGKLDRLKRIIRK
jgi:hypothetical protein